MKKILALILCFFIFFTNNSFAYHKDLAKVVDYNDIGKIVNEIESVDNRIKIMIKNISGDDELDLNYFNKNIKYCESILTEQSNRLTDLYSRETDFIIKRTYSALLYTITLYELSLCSMLVYINNDAKIDYFIDTCASYRNSNLSLYDIKLKLKNS